jgi:predicted cation transporter
LAALALNRRTRHNRRDGWTSVTSVLILILIMVLLGPILIKQIEHNLELFFLVVGVGAAIAGRQFGDFGGGG